MTSDKILAFARPEIRAAATAPAGATRDRISLRDYIRKVEIGAFQEERGVTQRLRFDVVVEVGHGAAPLDDDVDRILSYDTIVDAVERALSEERVSLLETLAERIAEILLADRRCERVFVRIEKLDRGPFALGVEIERTAAARRGAGPPPEVAARPLVLFLSNAAIADPRLPAWLDQIEALGGPVVLTVGMPEHAPPDGLPVMPQRRVDLLALDQNAWVLAARDRRCLVVDTRTEIAHAIQAGRIVVWAPTKIVIDAIEPPASGPRDPGALAAWFAEVLEADRVLGLGQAVPGGDRLDLADRLAL